MLPKPISRIVLCRVLLSLALLSSGLLLLSVPVLHGSVQNGPVKPVALPAATDPPESDTALHRTEGVLTCLLMGTDAGDARADTIMLAVLNTNDSSAALVSVPRDTLVRFNGAQCKINAVCALAGPEGVASVLSDMLSIPVDYYALVGLEGFEVLVDSMGGVWFDVPADMDYEDPTQDLYIHLKSGYQLLSGEQALGLLRCRSVYPDADLGRVDTQRQFLSAMAQQAAATLDLRQAAALMEIMDEHVNTNMSLSVMLRLATRMMGSDGVTLTSATLPGTWISPYIQLDDEAVLEMVNSLNIYQEALSSDALNICHS